MAQRRAEPEQVVLALSFDVLRLVLMEESVNRTSGLNNKA